MNTQSTTSRFQNQVVLITGGASGIGLATARAFAAEGAKVMLADRNAELAQQHATQLRQQGSNAASVGVDISNAVDCERMVAHTLSTFGALHVAINNAGIPSAIGGNFEDFAVAEWDRLISVNLSGVFYCMKAEVPALKAHGGTAIVNTASVASVVSAPGMAAYVAAKHGVAGLTKASALDLIKHGIRVNAVCPGMTNTPMLSGATTQPHIKAQLEAAAPIGRMAEADEVARAILFLASAEASYIVGTLLTVDGGVVLS